MLLRNEIPFFLYINKDYSIYFKQFLTFYFLMQSKLIGILHKTTNTISLEINLPPKKKKLNSILNKLEF